MRRLEPERVHVIHKCMAGLCILISRRREGEGVEVVLARCVSRKPIVGEDGGPITADGVLALKNVLNCREPESPTASYSRPPVLPGRKLRISTPS